MKQTLEYYYNILIDELDFNYDQYHFKISNYDYFFVFFNREKELDDILKCSIELKNKNIFPGEIVLNVQNDYITKIDDISYVLLKFQDANVNYEITDIIDFNKKLIIKNNKSSLYRNNWETLWITKVDYIESQLKEITVDKIIHNTIDYYIGLCENAIFYVNRINRKYYLSSDDHIVLSRKRVVYPNIKINYFNPLSFIFDLDVRDIAEYIKSMFFYGEDAYLELDTFLKSVKLTIYSYNMLFARLLYPSYYFDIYEKIINKHTSSEELIKYIDKISDYEIFLKKAYNLINLYAPLERIDWLIEKR